MHFTYAEFSEIELERYRSIRSEKYKSKLGLSIKEQDRWDSQCKHFLVRENNTVVGGCRAICRTDSTPLPMEDEGVDLDAVVGGLSGEKVAEISRLAAEGQLKADWMQSLFNDICIWALRNDITALLAIMPKPQARLYARALRSHSKRMGINAIISVSNSLQQTESIERKYKGIVDSMIVWRRPQAS